jgi:tetratricopeptide (TPR) repeat protein
MLRFGARGAAGVGRRLNPSLAEGSAMVAAGAGAAGPSSLAAGPSPCVATGLVSQRRWNIMPDGSTYKAKGMAMASMKMPMTQKAADQFNQLAKTAHQTRNLRDAVSLYDRVLTWRRDTLGADHPDVAASLHNIGRVFIDLRDPAQGQIALMEACRIYELIEGKTSLKYADSMGLLALCYRDLRCTVDAEKCFKTALTTYREHVYDFAANSWIPGDRLVPPQPNLHPLSTVAHLLSDAATLFLYQNELDRAASFLEDCLEIRKFLYGTNLKFKPIIAQTLSKLSEVRRSQGNITQAEILINEALDICIETVGRDSPATAAAYSSKGNCHSSKQQYREGLKCFQEAATTYALNFGKSSPFVASELLHIGRMHEMLNEIKEAESNYEKCLKMTKEVLGDDHVQVADASAYMASLQMKRTRFDKAVPLLREAIRIRTRVDKNDPALVFVYHRLGDALSAMQDPEAEAYFLQSIELHRRQSGRTQQLLMSDCLDDLGIHYLAFKHFDKAYEVFQEALKLRLEHLGDNHPTVGYSYSNISMYHLSKEQYKEGVKMAEEALKVYERSKTDQKLSIADAYMTLGQNLHGMGDLQGANANHLRALNMRRTQGELAELAVAESLNELARVCIDGNEQGVASDYLAEAFKIADKFGDNAARLREQLNKTQQMFTREQASIPPPADHPVNLIFPKSQDDPLK